jgi:general secretion pathway protein N
MRFWIAATGLGLFVYLFGLVAQLPAARLAPYLAEQGVVLESPRGSIWQGSATWLRLEALEIPAPSWELSPLALLIGQAKARLATGWGDARLRAGLGGDLELHDVDLVVPLQDIRIAGALQLGGEVKAHLPGLEIVEGMPRRAQGRVQWRNATLGAQGMVLGGFGLELETVNDKISGRISDSGGPVEANGAVILEPDGRYQLDLRLAARPGADAAIENGLRLLGTAEPGGGVRLRRKGRLQDLVR